MEFPLFVYRCPGQYPGPGGTTYSTEIVEGESELKSALANGWHPSLDLAVAADDAEPVIRDGNGESDDEPPTRDEMLEMADKLGIKVDKRWSDETLHSKIDAAIAESSAN